MAEQFGIISATSAAQMDFELYLRFSPLGEWVKCKDSANWINLSSSSRYLEGKVNFVSNEQHQIAILVNGLPVTDTEPENNWNSTPQNGWKFNVTSTETKFLAVGLENTLFAQQFLLEVKKTGDLSR